MGPSNILLADKAISTYSSGAEATESDICRADVFNNSVICSWTTQKFKVWEMGQSQRLEFVEVMDAVFCL